MSPELSIVVPAYNEAPGIAHLVAQLNRIVEPMAVSYEILIVNDGSRDNTAEVLHAVSQKDPRVVPVNLARNFGKESAMAAGLSEARGNAIVFIDADLQHPPELIPEMVRLWREGADVVNAVKRTRAEEPAMYRKAAALFNKVMTHAVGQNMEGASDYKLIDRQVAQVLLDCPERKRFFRGLVNWVGFQVRDLEFDVQLRETGTTKWSTMSLIRYSINNVLIFSSLPLRLVGYIGFIVATLGFLLLAQTMYRYFENTAAIGFTTVIAVQIMLGGMILLALGVIAVYLSNIYDEQKARPIFIIRRPRESAAIESRAQPASSVPSFIQEIQQP